MTENSECTSTRAEILVALFTTETRAEFQRFLSTTTFKRVETGLVPNGVHYVFEDYSVLTVAHSDIERKQPTQVYPELVGYPQVLFPTSLPEEFVQSLPTEHRIAELLRKIPSI